MALRARPTKRQATEADEDGTQARSSASDARTQLVESISATVNESVAASIRASVSEALEARLGDVDSLFATMLQAYDDKAVQRFNTIEAGITELQEKQAAPARAQQEAQCQCA